MSRECLLSVQGYQINCRVGGVDDLQLLNILLTNVNIRMLMVFMVERNSLFDIMLK